MVCGGDKAVEHTSVFGCIDAYRKACGVAARCGGLDGALADDVGVLNVAVGIEGEACGVIRRRYLCIFGIFGIFGIFDGKQDLDIAGAAAGNVADCADCAFLADYLALELELECTDARVARRADKAGSGGSADGCVLCDAYGDIA